ncbi:MAG: PTS sugar transporter subunit IIC [bacterium]|nr:PTS sugar transporter subunit IIC [bacterium]
MNKLVKWLERIFIDGLSGMALGLFATLIVGTIIKQVAPLFPSDIGGYITMVGAMASCLTGAGIGCGVAYKFQESPLVVVSAAVAGMIGAQAKVIVAGTLVTKTGIAIATGDPLGAFIAAYVAIEVGHFVSGKTNVDILITPILSISFGALVGILLGPKITELMNSLGTVITWATEQRPFLMGVIISVIMGMALTLPISSAALGIILSLHGLPAGAATVGCCVNMVGFAVISYRDNGIGGLLGQGLGTSMLQIPNIVRKPIIWLPVILTSAILGPVSTLLFKMTNNSVGSGMGTAGLVGQIQTYSSMVGADGVVITLFKIIILHFILPAALCLTFSEFMKKKGWIKNGDMKLEL